MVLHRPCIKSIFALAASALVSIAAAQTTLRLPQYLDSLKWDVAGKGPLVAVVTGRQPAKGVQGLAAYARKTIVVGGITTVAPVKMITIDDSMKTPPNMYDGLPIEAKVLYLASTFDSGQTTKAAGPGIGLGDLRQDQHAVFLSILPNPFGWQKGIVAESGIPDEKAKGTLTDDQRTKVRLRIVKAIAFHMGLADGSRGYTFHDTVEEYGRPGDTCYWRDDRQDFDRHDAFGVSIRKEEENRLKKAHLNYAAGALQASISLQPEETVASLLRRIGGATGLEIYADMRVGGLKVKAYGAKATASELLQAAALGVTGTYRQVGGAFVLTSDLVGMGTRKLRLSLWQSDIQKEVWNRMTDWRIKLKEAGALSKFDFDDEASLAPEGDTKKALDKFESANGSESVDTSTLSPNLRGFLDRVNKRYTAQQVRTDRVSMETSLRFGFVLPDGNKLHLEHTSLGEPWGFVQPKAPVLPRPDGPIGPVQLAPTQAVRALAIRIEDVRQIDEIVGTTKALGFNELWVATRDAGILRATAAKAKAAGLIVRLSIRPWQALPSDPVAALDQTLGGQTTKELLSLPERSTTFQEFVNRMKGTDAHFHIEAQIAPDERTAIRWQQLVTLAQTPDVSGVVLDNSRPVGYEPERTPGISMEPVIPETLNYGYTSALRLGFLRQYQVDPIDIAPPHLNFDSDLRQPFFLDNNLRASSSVYDGRDEPMEGFEGLILKWHQFRAAKNQAAVVQLLNALNGRSLMVAVSRKIANGTYAAFTALVPWKMGDPIPEDRGGPGAGFEAPENIISLLVPANPDPTALNNFGYIVTGMSKPEFRFSVAFDATWLSSEQALKALARYIKPATN